MHRYPQEHAAGSPHCAQGGPQGGLDQPSREAYLRRPGVPGPQVHPTLPGKGATGLAPGDLIAGLASAPRRKTGLQARGPTGQVRPECRYGVAVSHL